MESDPNRSYAPHITSWMGERGMRRDEGEARAARKVSVSGTYDVKVVIKFVHPVFFMSRDIVTESRA